MAFYPCNAGGFNLNKKTIWSGVLPDGYTNVDINDLPDWPFESYGLKVTYNGVLYVADSVLLKKGASSNLTYYSENNPSDDYVMVNITWYANYIRLRIGSVHGVVPISGTNLPVELFTTNVGMATM